MLTYVSSGTRNFGSEPFGLARRLDWEIYGVIEGEIAPWPSNPLTCTGLFSQHLWLFPPHHEHGWIGRSSNKSIVVVFHYTELPAGIASLVPENGLCLPLTQPECSRLLKLARDLQNHRCKHDGLFDYYSQRGLMDLAILVAGKMQPMPSAGLSVSARVQLVETWYREHLTECPTLGHLARQAGLTEGHLRRLFHAERKQSPKAVMRAIQIEVAERLLVSTDLKVDVIARACGFASPDGLFRVFRSRHGATPTAWRIQARKTTQCTHCPRVRIF